VGGQATDIAITAENIIKWKNILNERLSYHTGQPLEQIQKDVERDNYMMAQQALEYGLIDKIVGEIKIA